MAQKIKHFLVQQIKLLNLKYYFVASLILLPGMAVLKPHPPPPVTPL